MNKSLTGGVILAALTWALQANSVQAAPVCTADPAAEDGAEVLSVDVETVGDTQSVCASFADGLGSGFELSFSGTGDDSLFGFDDKDYLYSISPDSNLDEFALRIRFVEFLGTEILEFDLVEEDIISFLWEVDGTGGRLQELEMLSFIDVEFGDPLAPSFAQGEVNVFYDFDDDGSFVSFNYETFCSEEDLQFGCADDFDFFFTTLDPVAFDGSGTGGGDGGGNGGGDNNTAVPAPASLLLMAAGLGLLRRRRAPFRQRAA
jgi:hypothetical protein